MMVPPRIAVIIASFNCTAACENCCFDSHPGIHKRLSNKQIMNFIDKIVEFQSIRLLVFTGGECFLLGNDLDRAIKYAHERNLDVRCVTNGYWAASELQATKRLEALKKVGLSQISFSTGDFHQKFVPEASVINGIVSALRLKISTSLVVEIQKDRKVSAERILSNKLLSEVLSEESAKKLFSIKNSHWMPMSLNGEVTQNRSSYANIFNIDKRKGCTDIFDHVVVTPDERIGLCCGLTRELIPELHLKEKDLNSLVENYHSAARDFLKLWIHVEGPEKIIAWAADKDPSIEWEYKYAHRCHACYALYQDSRIQEVIRKYYHEKEEEILERYRSMVDSKMPIISPQLT